MRIEKEKKREKREKTLKSLAFFELRLIFPFRNFLLFESVSSLEWRKKSRKRRGWNGKNSWWGSTERYVLRRKIWKKRNKMAGTTKLLWGEKGRGGLQKPH